MKKTPLIGSTVLLLGSVSMAPSVAAETASPAGLRQTLGIVAEVRSFSDHRGTLSSITVEEEIRRGDTTIVLAPTIGERDTPSATYDAVGMRGTVYQDWSPVVSTRTTVFLAEKTPVFAHIDVAQDVTVRVADRTTVTAGIRWAEYDGGNEAAFASLGVRRYFEGGSIAYRLTGAEVDGDDFFAHLINLRLDDSEGGGSTQLWLSVGDAASSQFDDSFNANNRSVTLQRTQPLWDNVALVAAAGLSEYRSAGGHYTATTFRVGLSTMLD
ncbi:MAG: YaiO family outer membrane beta-barrel protein [Alphaproteobacteria bacterium]|nr:YaiO family outer membrane beta-barrel protein [Alphaproteobacteria bacterium]